MNKNPNLDSWLSDNFSVQKTDLIINLKKIAENASRYSKEHLEADGDPASIEDFFKGWIKRVKQSREEDEEGKERSGQDVYIAEGIAAIRKKLQAMGDTISLDQFPFDQIPPSAQEFVARALQKELSSAIKRKTNLDPFKSAMIYADNNLKAILESELGRRDIIQKKTDPRQR